MRDRVLRDFEASEIQEIAETLSSWQSGEDYKDITGYCKSATLEEIRKNDYILTPGRYVGAPEAEDEGIPFAAKTEQLRATVKTQFEERAELEAKIKKNVG